MRRIAIAAALALTAVISPAGAQTTVTRSYIGGFMELATYSYCDGSSPLGLPAPSGQGRVCFSVAPGATTLDITVTDAVVPLFVPALYAFLDGQQRTLAQGGFCDAVVELEVPPAATQIFVFFPESPLSYYPACPLFATTGTLTATFSP